jgi:peptidoglycan hydrolase-like protein with peptidoglycan-binding domain
MKKLPLVVLSLLMVFMFAAAAQNNNSNKTTGNSTSNKAKSRGPIFRASADQVKQAQAILKQRAFYSGEQTGKLDPDTRSGLKQYQTAEGLKPTGTLNKVTLVKMSIVLTDKQKAM